MGWCVMQFPQRTHQQLHPANVPFPLRRLPCEKLARMLQRHRRHPWCMWSGCQRPHFLLSGLMWAGQTQILAQHGLHAPPLWFQRSYPSLTVDIPSWGFVRRITGYAASQCLKCFLWGKQVSNYRKNKETTVKQHKKEILDLWHTWAKKMGSV